MAESTEKQVLFLPCKKPTFGEKLWYCFLAGVLFLLVANPVTFQIIRGLVSRLFGIRWARLIADDRGCANVTGLLLHSIVFMILIFLIMLVTEAVKEEFGDFAYPV